MKLKLLLSGIETIILQKMEGWEEIEVTGVTKDSRNIQKGEVFVCIRGAKEDGHEYLWDAYTKKVGVFVVEECLQDKEFLEFPKDATIIQTKDTQEAYAVMAANFWGHPARGLTVIGITGTKGKTTTSMMVKTLLEQQKERVGIVGTFGIYDGEKWTSQENTTPDAFTIHQYFGKMKKNGCRYVIMEVSSQGIKQKRIYGIDFEIAVFTNLGTDHIGPGEHRSIEEYRYYKSQLFEQCRIGICNLDDLATSYMFRRKRCKKYGYSCQKELLPDYWFETSKVLQADKIEQSVKQGEPLTCFWVEGQAFHLNLPGMFNVENALAALQVMQCLSYDISTMQNGLAHVQINGRMERILNKKRIACYIDYAHNGLSLQKALEILRAYRPGRIFLIFGCGGNRAKARRTEMGRVAGRYADHVILTNDNPRDEEPEKIIGDIVDGMQREPEFYEIILDRRKAVERAVELACAGDMILIAGKGHETSQEIQGIQYTLDDHELLQTAWEKRERAMLSGDKERVEEAECTQI